jgi:hypothetical protein
LHSLIDHNRREAQYCAVLHGTPDSTNILVKKMTTFAMLQVKHDMRRGSITAKPVCLWAKKLVLGRT